MEVNDGGRNAAVIGNIHGKIIYDVTKDVGVSNCATIVAHRFILNHNSTNSPMFGNVDFGGVISSQTDPGSSLQHDILAVVGESPRLSQATTCVEDEDAGAEDKDWNSTSKNRCEVATLNMMSIIMGEELCGLCVII